MKDSHCLPIDVYQMFKIFESVSNKDKITILTPTNALEEFQCTILVKESLNLQNYPLK